MPQDKDREMRVVLSLGPHCRVPKPLSHPDKQSANEMVIKINTGVRVAVTVEPNTQMLSTYGKVLVMFLPLIVFARWPPALASPQPNPAGIEQTLRTQQLIPPWDDLGGCPMARRSPTQS